MCVLYVSLGSSVTPSILGVCSWVVLFICRCRLVFYSAGSHVNIVSCQKIVIFWL